MEHVSFFSFFVYDLVLFFRIKAFSCFWNGMFLGLGRSGSVIAELVHRLGVQIQKANIHVKIFIFLQILAIFASRLFYLSLFVIGCFCYSLAGQSIR